MKLGTKHTGGIIGIGWWIRVRKIAPRFVQDRRGRELASGSGWTLGSVGCQPVISGSLPDTDPRGASGTAAGQR